MSNGGSGRHAVQIEAGPGPYSHKVLIDGVDVAGGLLGLTLSAQRGQLPTLELDINTVDVTTFADPETRVMLAEGTAELLIALGWTPPEEAQ